jgi:predicted nuclease of predicted toxin-antitoxin system
MIGIMSDHDIAGLATTLFQRCRDEWSEFFDELDVRIVTFEDLDLASDAADSEIWHACQLNNVVLVTANRNEDSDESLEATIRQHNQPDSLPVLTVGNVHALRMDSEYFHRTIDRLMETLIDIDALRGAGRLYIP